MTGRCLLGLTLLLSPAAGGQVVQGYLGGGFASPETWYAVGGADLALPAEDVVLIPGAAILHSEDGARRVGTTPLLFRDFPVAESFDLSTVRLTTRLTLSNRVEVPLTPSWTAALTAAVSVDLERVRTTEVYSYEPRPAPGGWDTTFRREERTTRWMLTAGPECITGKGDVRAGGGVLIITDGADVHRFQTYLILGTHPTRRVVARIWAGGVTDRRFTFFARGSASWRITPEFTGSVSAGYARSSFLFNPELRYLNHYREKDQVEVGVTGVLDVTLGWTLFGRLEYQVNDRFSMAAGGAGVAVRLGTGD